MIAPVVIAKIRAAVKVLYDKKLRNRIVSLLGSGVMLIVFILCLFLFIISGLIGLLVDTYVKDNWKTIRVNIYDVFETLDLMANSQVKTAVYDFMPNFSVNLSKAAISANYHNDLLIYDTAEYEKVKLAMESAAEDLRNVHDESEYASFCKSYNINCISTDYSAVSSDTAFINDEGISSVAEYSDTVYGLLADVADNKLNNYEYTFEEYETDDGKSATRQTLTVTGEEGTQVVEYNAVGEVELYLPEFIALYQVRLMEDVYILGEDEEAAERNNQAIEDTLGGDIGQAENEEELQDAIEDTSSSDISSILSFMQIADLKSILQNNLSGEGGVGAKVEYKNGIDVNGNRESRIVITLEAPSNEEWMEVFEIDATDQNCDMVDEFQATIEQILIDAGIDESEFYLNLDDFFQNALFVYFEGFFNLPVESTELVADSNGIIDKYGDYSKLHRIGYSYSKAFESGVTLAVANAGTEIKVDLLPSVKTDCIEDIVIYDIWKSGGKNGEYNNQTMDSISYGCDMITLAYTINTVTFKKDYGFSFPAPSDLEEDEMSDTITMLVEFSCLSKCYYPTISYQVGDSIRDVVMNGDFSIGLCHDGINTDSDTAINANWYHHYENTPHVTIKIAFFNYNNIDLYDTNTSTYAGITGSNYTDYWYQDNPMLWFKGFRTEVDDETLEGLVAA